MNGTYLIAEKPYCAEKRIRVSVIRWLGDRVLLQDEEMKAKGVDCTIESDLASFIPDIPSE